jgi:hypothetical protein
MEPWEEYMTPTPPSTHGPVVKQTWKALFEGTSLEEKRQPRKQLSEQQMKVLVEEFSSKPNEIQPPR